MEGNDIGTDATGTIPLGNMGRVSPSGSSLANTIGGTAIGAGNTIAFNSGAGVIVGFLSDDASDGNSILGNAIYDNSGAGVLVGSYSSDPSTENAILSNSIYGNGSLGIDLGDDFITQNTPGGPTPSERASKLPGAHDRRDVQRQHVCRGDSQQHTWASFTIQFFSNAPADPTGYGQGQSLIGTTTVTTDANGNASVSTSFPTLIPAGDGISATATDSSGDTSEFDQDVTVFAASGLVVAVNDTYNVFTNSAISVAAPGVQGNDYELTGNPLSSARLRAQCTAACRSMRMARSATRPIPTSPVPTRSPTRTWLEQICQTWPP